MNENYKKKFIAVVLLFIVLSGTVNAWSFTNFLGNEKNSYSDKLKEIEQRTNSFNENERVMRFINKNMFDQGVDTIQISIKNDKQIVKTYFIIRNTNKNDAALLVEKVPDDMGIVWKLKPTVDQALDGLIQTSAALTLYNKKDRSKLEVSTTLLKGLYLYINIDKVNVPSIKELIQRSTCKCKKALRYIGFL